MGMKEIPGVLEMIVYVCNNSSRCPVKISPLYAHYCIWYLSKEKD